MNRLIFSLLLILLAVAISQGKGWRGIVPLHSTRADVERLLGPPTIDRSEFLFYESDKERITVRLSRGPCDVEFSSWNVARNTVIAISITPRARQLSFAGLNLNTGDYLKVRDNHRGDIVYYRNEVEGIEYTVDEAMGTVDGIEYSPSAADAALRCPEPRNLLKETISFAKYSNISFAAEKKILDRFAQQITRYTSVNYASAQAYIYAYSADHGTVRDARFRAERAKEYLVKTNHIDANRIEIRNAGFRHLQTIELYLVPPGGNPPRLGSPTAPKR